MVLLVRWKNITCSMYLLICSNFAKLKLLNMAFNLLAKGNVCIQNKNAMFEFQLIGL